MGTSWHQDKAIARDKLTFQHPTQYTVVSGAFTVCLTRFTNIEAANHCAHLTKGYVVLPSQLEKK